MSEQWRVITEYPRYAISDCGRAKIIKSGKALKPQPNRHGYHRVNLYKDGKMKSITIHSLVLKYFVGNRPDGFVIAHINGNKTDNRLSNIKYATIRENEDHKLIHGSVMTGTKHGRAKLSEEDVHFIREHYKPRDKTFNTYKLADKFGVHHTMITKIVKRINWSHL